MAGPWSRVHFAGAERGVDRSLKSESEEETVGITPHEMAVKW